ncbi:MAG TPA: hypothetical protein ENH50_04975 [Nitrospirae bacterium]|nr:hypothetical protein [Nitrospirota bacterium]
MQYISIGDTRGVGIYLRTVTNRYYVKRTDTCWH